MQEIDDFLDQRSRNITLDLIEESRSAKKNGRVNEWAQGLMSWCMSSPDLKGRILRFVDVLPSLQTDKAITDHIRDYFPASESRLPLPLRGGSLLSSGPWTGRAVSNVTRKALTQIAGQFICGSTPEEAARALSTLKAKGWDFTLDVLGEAALSSKEADAYQETYVQLIQKLPPESNLSVKLSSLTAQFSPVSFERTIEDVLKRLKPIVLAAMKRRSFINVDMERYETRDLSLEIFKRLLLDPEIKGYPHLGIVFQAYLKDSEPVLKDFLNWIKEKGRPITIRLVKGAYWDSEVAWAKARGWPIPVFQNKNNTDKNFETLTRLLMENREFIRVAIASHNARSVGAALAIDESMGASKNSLEFQFLFGMADALKQSISRRERQVRVYCPFGEPIPGMAYLVRRILENTSNESFLKLEFDEGQNPEELAAAPTSSPEPEDNPKPNDFQNEPLLDFSKESVRAEFQREIETAHSSAPQKYPLLIGANRIETGEWISSHNPSDPERLIGQVARGRAENVEEAVNISVQNQPFWDRQKNRSNLLRKAAALLRDRRVEMAALECLEVGKTRQEADADVCEAIDFLEFYARSWDDLTQPNRLRQVPGEDNSPLLKGRGVAAVIAPWNFPVAILTGMTAAALIAGNAAIVKPAENAVVLAAKVIALLREAGVPAEVLHFLPGPGSEVGSALAAHPLVDLVAFTGSKEVGLSLVQTAGYVSPGQKNVKNVIAEMGGKNAIIVDEDADLDEALEGVLQSAFGYQGQKCSACSRLILLDGIYDRFLERLIEGAAALKVGLPEDPASDLGPVVDLDAKNKINAFIDQGRSEARLAFAGRIPTNLKGHFIAPHIFTDAPRNSALIHHEIFGPVLTVLRARSFGEALDIANDVEFGLTAGVYSRRLTHVEKAKQALQAGNIYVNRKITGAYVSRQPFGGIKMSGLGSRAGSKNYLLQFCFETTITENTFRHGFPI